MAKNGQGATPETVEEIADDATMQGATPERFNPNPQIEYTKYRVDDIRGEIVDGKTVGYFGRFIERLKKPGLTSSCKIESDKAAMLNAGWYTSGIYMHPSSEPMPDSIHRTISNGEYTDKVTK